MNSPVDAHLLASFSQLEGEVLIFGGTFDPVHVGHIRGAELAQRFTGAKSVVFVPNHQNPLKPDAPLGSDQERTDFLLKAIHGKQGWYVSTAQLPGGVGTPNSLPVSRYTIDLIREIKKNNGRITIHLLIGADQLDGLHRWKEYPALFLEAQVWVLGRNHILEAQHLSTLSNLSFAERAHLSGRFIPFQEPVAASQIRAASAASESSQVIEWLPAGVGELVLKSKNYFPSK